MYMLINLEFAGNILASNDYNVHFSSFLPKLQAKDLHTRVLAYLVMTSLIKQLSGEHQIEAACKILDAIGSDDTFTKPNSKSTLQRLQLDIVVAISSIPAPGVPLDWIADLDVVRFEMFSLMSIVT